MKRALSFVFLLFIASNLSAQKKPNIIYILVDDLGYGDIGVYYQNQRKLSGDKGLPFQLTPELDKMANTGAVFTQQYANAPVCAPSRASLLTGVNQGNAHVRDNQFDKALEHNQTMATVLKQAGYFNVAIGKWGLQGDSDKQKPNWPAHPLKRGFDYYYGYMRHADGHEHYPFEGLYRGKKEVYENYKEVSAGLAKSYTTDLFTAKAKSWIIDYKKSEKKDAPFFMYLAYDAPHAVLELPTQAYPANKGLNGGLKWLGKEGEMINTASGTIDSYNYPEYADATYQNKQGAVIPWPDTYKRYASSVRRIDDGVGDLLQLLKDLKIDENTIVVFSSDNGPSVESYLPKGYAANEPTFFGSYGPFDGIKRDCWEGGLRMPVLANWPGHIEAGKVITTPSMLSDWLPTFASLAQTVTPARADGVSLVPALTGKGKQKEGIVYVEYYEGGKTPKFPAFEASRRGRNREQMQMIRFGDLVGVRYDVKSANDDFEIYNVVKDPKQIINLASENSSKVIQQKMKDSALQLRSTDEQAKRPYDTEAIPAIKNNTTLKPGLKWNFFEGAYNYTFLVDDKKPNLSGIAKDFIIPKNEKAGMLFYTAYLKIDTKGVYTFALKTDNKAFVRLHDAHLFDTNIDYTPNTELQKLVLLEAGYHPIKVYYLKQSKSKGMIDLKFKSKNGSWVNVKQICVN